MCKNQQKTQQSYLLHPSTSTSHTAKSYFTTKINSQLEITEQITVYFHPVKNLIKDLKSFKPFLYENSSQQGIKTDTVNIN